MGAALPVMGAALPVMGAALPVMGAALPVMGRPHLIPAWLRALLLGLVVWSLPGVAAAAPTLDVSVDRTRLAPGDRLTLKITLRSERIGLGGAGLTEPNLDGFAVVGRMSFNSFDSRSRLNEQSLQLVMVPTRTGTLVIPPFQFDSEAGPLTTEAVKIEVADPTAARAPDPNAVGGPPAANPANPGQPNLGQPNLGPGNLGGMPPLPPPRLVPQAPGAPALGEATRVLPDVPPDRVGFVRWELEKTDLWLGEQIEVRLVLYLNEQLRVTDFEVSDVNPQGFWTHDRRERNRPRLVQFGNEVFRREDIYYQQLFPLRAGALELPRVEARFNASSRGLGRRSEIVVRAAEKVPLAVKALPTEGRPNDFRGPAVGNVRLEARPNRTVVNAEDGLQLTVTTRVDGLIENVPEVELGPIDGFRVFPPSKTESTSARGEQISGVRRQIFLLRPTRAGRLVIPAISVPYFDPGTGRYARANTPPVTVTVQGTPRPESEAAGPATASGSGATAGSGPAPAALRGIHAAVDLTPAATAGHLSWGLWLALVLPPLAFLGLVLSERFRQRHQAGAGDRQARRAARVALAALAEASKAPPAQAYGAIAHALIAYLEARFSKPFKGLTHPRLLAVLAEHKVAATTATEWVTELENCDFARFAPGGGASDVSAAAQRAVALVERVEREVAA